MLYISEDLVRLRRSQLLREAEERRLAAEVEREPRGLSAWLRRSARDRR